MAAIDLQETLDQAIAKTNLTHIEVRHRPRLLSDNGPSFLADDLKGCLKRYRIKHIRSAPYHPVTQGKIECYHRSMKNREIQSRREQIKEKMMRERRRLNRREAKLLS